MMCGRNWNLWAGKIEGRHLVRPYDSFVRLHGDIPSAAVEHNADTRAKNLQPLQLMRRLKGNGR